MTSLQTVETSLQLLSSGTSSAVALRRGLIQRVDEPPAALLPGAFNPLHEGHSEMAQRAARVLSLDVAFELSITNVDKPGLCATDVLDRVQQFHATHTIWLTRADTFVKKARVFPGTTFVVGADTILRVGLPKYYRDDADQRDRSIRELQQLGSRFLVFGRVASGRFLILDDLAIPDELRKLCRGVAESTFRNDISSTQLRGRGTRENHDAHEE